MHTRSDKKHGVDIDPTYILRSVLRIDLNLQKPKGKKKCKDVSSAVAQLKMLRL